MPTLRNYLESAREYALDAARKYDPNAPLGDRLESFRVFCLALKMIAYARLLLESDVEGFFVNLHRVALNGRNLLRMVREEPQSNRRIPASHNAPLLAALVTDLTLAREIATLSARERTPPEYDDEFYGAFFLQESVRPRAPEEPSVELEGLCQKMDDYLEEETPRSRTLRALARRDWAEFEAAFEVWNEGAARALAHAADSPGATYSMGITQHIWLEGLAVLKLAESQGFSPTPVPRPRIPGLVLAARPSLAGMKPLVLGAAWIDEDDL